MTVNLTSPLWQFLAVALGTSVGWCLMALLRQAAAHTCFFGHRMKRYVSTKLFTNFSCRKSAHPVHRNPNIWATRATWHCSACQATGEECLGEGTFWKVGPEGGLEIDEKFDSSKLEKPWEAEARGEDEQKKKARWLTHEEAYGLVRDLVEAHREKTRAQAPAPPESYENKVIREIKDMMEQASENSLNRFMGFPRPLGPQGGGGAGAHSDGPPHGQR